MNRKLTFLIFALTLALLAALTGCTLSLAEPTPTAIVLPTQPPPTDTFTPVPPTATPVVPTSTMVLPTATSTVVPPTNAPLPIATGENPVVPGSPSGPYAVILVAENDVLNVRSGPGLDYSVASTFAPTAVNVMRTGPSRLVGNDLWVEVQKTGGGTGWVNSAYLTEYVASGAFCADTKVNTLLTTFGNAIKAGDGATLGPLASPAHGVDVRLHRISRPPPFDQEHFRWVFESTYEHNWGSGPSGLDEVGPFHEIVLPVLLDALKGSPTLTCNDASLAGAVVEPWPHEYTNINFYTLYKPGSPGVDLDWNTWLVGVEYVNGQPYLFALINFRWEP